MTPFVPRVNVFTPIFFIPAVAAAIWHIGLRFRNENNGDLTKPGQRLGAGIALLTLLDIYPSNFQLPYRPDFGDLPVAKALANIGPSRGRVAVASPDRLYGNISADFFGDFPQVDSPSIFGPTFQLGTKMLGYATMITTRAWHEFDKVGDISQRFTDYFALLDVSDLLIYERDRAILHRPIPHYRPAWRIEQFVCDPTPSPLTKLNWDDMRALGFGEMDLPFEGDTEINIDSNHGIVSGVRVNCTDLDTSKYQHTAQNGSIPPVTD